MSVLGDYIHLNASNYLKYGIARNKFDKKKPSLATVYAQQKRVNQQRIKNISSIKKETLNELRKRIGKNFGPEKERTDVLIKEKAETKTISDFQKKLQSEVTGNPLVKKVTSLKASGEEINIDKAIKARELLFKRIKYFNDHPNESSPQTILNHIDTFFTSLGFTIPSEAEWLIQKKDIITGNKNIMTALKEIVMADCFSNAYSSAIRGQMGEQIVAMCDDAIYYNAVKDINNAIESAIVGGDGTSFALDKSFISKGVAATYQEKYKQNLYQVRKTQDKVDVQLNINNESINASVKAYTPKGSYIKPHLQDIQLLTSLATTVPHFANHWLNLHCATTTLPKGNLLDNALDEHLKYEALAKGNLLKKGSLEANTFVTIDVTTGKVYAVNIKDILEKKAPGTNFILNPMTRSIYIEGNKKQDTYQERIADIINNVRQVQISASLSINRLVMK